MNRLHVDVEIRKLVMAGKDEKETYHNIRELIPTHVEMGYARSEVEKSAAAFKKSVDGFHTKVERRRAELDTDEVSLRADLVDALDGCDISDPAVAREVWTQMRNLLASEGEPVLIETLDMLDELKVDTTTLRGRLTALGYPTHTPEEK